MIEQEVVPVWPLLVIVGGFIVVFSLFWCFVIWLLSHISGWQRLAQRYHTLRPVTGKRWSWQYGMIGWIGYNGVLVLTANGDGLFMQTLWLFSFGHNVFFVPWHEFYEAKIVNIFFMCQVRAKIGFPHLATVHLPAAVFEQSEGRKVLEKQSTREQS
jgi:hypothetical protein